MHRPSVFYTIIIICLAALLLLLGAAFAFRSDAEPAAKTKILSIPACAFQPIRWGDDWNMHREGAQLYWAPSSNPDDDMGCFYAPLMLPDGARIKRIAMVYRHAAPPSIKLQLWKSSLVDNAIQDTMLTDSLVSLMSPDWYRSGVSPTNLPKIDNNASTYYLCLTLGGSDSPDNQVHHVEVHYKGKW